MRATQLFRLACKQLSFQRLPFPLNHELEVSYSFNIQTDCSELIQRQFLNKQQQQRQIVKIIVIV